MEGYNNEFKENYEDDKKTLALLSIMLYFRLKNGGLIADINKSYKIY